MPKIQIKQTMGAIAVEVQKAKVEIQQKRPSLYIKSIPAKFTIRKKMPTFKLKQSENLFASGYRTNLALSSLKFQKARQRTLEAIERIASEGDAIMRIENRVNPIPLQAIANAEENIDLQIAMMPRNEIQWDMGFVDIEWTPHKTDIIWDVNPKPQIVVHPHSVRIHMKRWPSVEISVKNNKNKYYTKLRSKYQGR